MSVAAPGHVDDPPPRRRRWAAVAAWASVAAYVTVAGLVVWFGVRSYAEHAPPDVGLVGWNAVNVMVTVVFATFVVAGALIVARRPVNTVGWVMLAGGIAFGLRAFGDTYTLVALGGPAGEPSTLGLGVKLTTLMLLRFGAVLLLVFLPLIYPDGRLPSSRWRPFAWAAGLYTALWIVSGAASERLTGSAFPLGREPIEIYDVANPLAIEWLQRIDSQISGGVEAFLLLAFVIGAVVVVVTRFRRSRGIERQQMKWFTSAAGLYVVLFGVSILMAQPLDAPAPLVQTTQGLAYVALTAYPAAIGMAVLRYRLYDIDRLISRTVSYGLIVAVLGGVYVAGVVGLGAAVTALTGAEDSDLVVAVSTLAVAGLFRPVRARIQSAVDRRFNRTGYEARRAVEAFTREIRDEVDLEQIRTRVAETAAVATQPTQVSVWLSERGSER